MSSDTSASTTPTTDAGIHRRRRRRGRYLAGVATVAGVTAASLTALPTAGADTYVCTTHHDVTAGPVIIGRAAGQCLQDPGVYFHGINGASGAWSLGTLYLPDGQMIRGHVNNVWGLPGQSIILPGF